MMVPENLGASLALLIEARLVAACQRRCDEQADKEMECHAERTAQTRVAVQQDDKQLFTIQVVFLSSETNDKLPLCIH